MLFTMIACGIETIEATTPAGDYSISYDTKFAGAVVILVFIASVVRAMAMSPSQHSAVAWRNEEVDDEDVH